jgi:hypothetical protein
MVVWSRRAGLLAMVVVLLGVAPARREEAVRDLLRCYDGQPPPEELSSRLEKALETHRGTEMDDDILLALAQAQISSHRLNRALAILEGLTKDQSARKIDMLDLWVGWGTGAGGSEVKELYEESPDFTSDHALLTLAHLQRELGDLRKCWEAFEKLRNKYPRGDRVKEDLQFMKEFRKKHPELPRRLVPGLQFSPARLPEGGRMVTFKVPEAVARASSFSELFLLRRRPHLRGLQEQAALCQQMGRSSEERVAILKDIVGIYDPLLTEEELTDYCRQGLTEIESLQEKARPETLNDLNQAAKVFTQALEKLAEEEKEHSAKDSNETGAKTNG